ncbi:MAG TPA: adenylyl-sulfate kinase [Polyangiaceae bacterium]|jgi:adenylylsulfate kinase|nr:adenylyl-sulfate kinase [Polyangiaceae bacterium]
MSQGVVVWITGLPSAGKSTLAEQLHAMLDARGAKACVLDGDAVRKSLSPAPGYSAGERANFYETLARLAALLAAQGLVVLVPATAHRRAFRERARELCPAFFEVWVDTPLAECVKRDAKGLYAASRTGGATSVPGSDEAYEPPTQPDFTAHGTTEQAELERFVDQLTRAQGVRV